MKKIAKSESLATELEKVSKLSSNFNINKLLKRTLEQIKVIKYEQVGLLKQDSVFSGSRK